MSKSEIDQTKDGIKAITVCIAQALAESDPTFPERTRSRPQSMVRGLIRSRRGSRRRTCSERPTGPERSEVFSHCLSEQASAARRRM